MPMSTITRTARIACAREHAQLVRGIVEVAELAHQPLGVQRPAFAVPGHEPERALVPRQLVGEVPHLRRPAGDGRGRPRGSRSITSRHSGKCVLPSVGYQVRPGPRKSSLGPV